MSQSTDLAHASALAAEWYCRADVFEWDCQHLLSQHWQVIAPASQVAEPGDVLTRELAGVPIIVLRDESGALNGFFNVCRHRAGPVATCDASKQRHLRCAYHGWTYDLGGRLVHAPEMEDAAGFDATEISLRPVDIREWQGFIFARAGNDPVFDATLDAVTDVAGSAAFAGLQHHSAKLYDVQANWKVYVDNFLEGYHLPFVHPGLMQVLDYRDYETELGDGWSLQRAPVEASGAYGAGTGLYFFLFPNTMLNIMPGRVQTNRVVPISKDSCQVEFDFYYAPDAVERAAADAQFSDEVQEEDRLICERVQKGLQSGVYEPGRLSPRRESGVWHFHAWLRQVYGAAGL